MIPLYSLSFAGETTSGFEVNFGTGSSLVLGNNQVQSFKDALSTSELSRPSGSGILKMSKTGNGLENGSRGVVGNVGNAGNVNGKGNGNGKMKHGAANDRNNVAFYKVSKSQATKNDVITDVKKSHGDSSSKRGKINKRQLSPSNDSSGWEVATGTRRKTHNLDKCGQGEMERK